MSKEPMYYGIDMVATGENLSRLRQQNGLTVRDIQAYMGFTGPGAIYKWERGDSIPRLEHLRALCEIYDAKMDDILVWTHPPPD